MKTVQGDLLRLAIDGEFDVIVHGCNCMCQMGGGIAKTIKEVFPQVYQADLATTKGDRSKLGTVSYAYVAAPNTDHSFVVVNAYTQFHWNWKKSKQEGISVPADYDAIRSAMRQVAIQFPGARIGYPKIGAGLALGDWSIISTIIDEELDGFDHTYVEYFSGSDTALFGTKQIKKPK